MKVIYTHFIPFSEYRCMKFFKYWLVRKSNKDSFLAYSMTEAFQFAENHENIHSAQAHRWKGRKFLGLKVNYFFSYLTFYFRYLMDFNVLIWLRYGKLAYRLNRYEREAYSNDHLLDYLSCRSDDNDELYACDFRTKWKLAKAIHRSGDKGSVIGTNDQLFTQYKIV